jgi:hypothetical protein
VLMSPAAVVLWHLLLPSFTVVLCSAFTGAIEPHGVECRRYGEFRK